MGWLVVGGWVVFLFWRVKRARENAAELAASGELRSPLYWIGTTLAMSVLALIMYIAHLKPSEVHPALWLLAIALFVATLLIRRALQWRYPH
jgi:hypothetical protein